jgi:hypothetical protein
MPGTVWKHVEMRCAPPPPCHSTASSQATPPPPTHATADSIYKQPWRGMDLNGADQEESSCSQIHDQRMPDDVSYIAFIFVLVLFLVDHSSNILSI